MAARPVYAVFRRDGAPNVTPLARWRVRLAALDYAKALERQGTPAVVLYRDEDSELAEQLPWREVYRTGDAGPVIDATG